MPALQGPKIVQRSRTNFGPELSERRQLNQIDSAQTSHYSNQDREKNKLRKLQKMLEFEGRDVGNGNIGKTSALQEFIGEQVKPKRKTKKRSHRKTSLEDEVVEDHSF